MSRFSYQLQVAFIAFCAMTFSLNDTGRRQSSPQNPLAPPSKIEYFPPGAVKGFADFFSQHLSYLGEPSLWAAAVQDSTAESYRFDWLSGQHGYVLAIRLLIRSDGTAEAITVEQFPKSDSLVRTRSDVPGTEVDAFRRVIENAGFWKMPSEAEEDRKTYKLDASPWILEGIRNGGYHVVVRLSPSQSPFTDIVDHLAKNVTQRNETVIPRANPQGIERH